jgi:hypothetical protein
MVDLCDNINASRLGLLLMDVSLAAKGFLCPRHNYFTEGDMFFNPEKENKKLLKQWLSYREKKITGDQDMVRESIKDMKQNGNTPSFANFIKFDPKSASKDFLINWLSWYGLSSRRPRNKKWWQLLAKKTQKLRKNTLNKSSSKSPANYFQILDNQTIKKARLKLFFQSVSDLLDLLPREEFLPLVRLKPASQESSRTKWKQILSKFLGVSFLAAPIVYNYRTKLQTFYKNPMKVKIEQIKGLGGKTSSALLNIAGQVAIKTGSRVLGEKLNMPLLGELGPGIAKAFMSKEIDQKTVERVLGKGLGTDVIYATGNAIIR